MLAPSSRSLLLRRSGTLRILTLRPHRSFALLPLARATQQRPDSTPAPAHARSFHISAPTLKGIYPDSADPAPPNTEPDISGGSSTEEVKAAELSQEEYHEIADKYIEGLMLELEEICEKGHGKIDVEYSANVLTVNTPHGTYVLNKQPPNKQIWLSSPISGPMRFDFVLQGGDHQHLKEGTDIDDDTDLHGGAWVSIREGVALTELLKKEIGVDLDEEEDEIAKGPAIQ